MFMSSSIRPHRTLALLLMLSLAACGDCGEPPPSGVDAARTDAAVTTDANVGTDAMVSPDASAGSDATVSTDAAAGSDASTAPDAAGSTDAANGDAAPAEDAAVNHAPTAHAGADQAVPKRAVVTLDGTGSSDPEGNVLSYSWTQIAGASVTLDHTVPAQPIFAAPAAAGVLSFELVVSDGALSSSADQVDITVTDSAPTASAGPDQSVNRNVGVMLDGSGSTDPEGDPLTYLWTQTAGASVTLDHSVPRRPTFTAPNVSGLLVFSLVVNDGSFDSAPDTVEISVANGRPTANARTTTFPNYKNTLVTLDGSRSDDPDGDPLTYRWVQVQGDTVTLDETDPIYPTFIAPGYVTDLRFNLFVHDGYEESANAHVDVHVVDRSPVADAGDDQRVDPLDVVTLDGTGSSDPDGDALSYLWTQTTGASVTLDHAVPAQPTFTAPTQTGVLTFELVVSDAVNASTPDIVRVVVGNHAPVAVAGDDQNSSRGATVNLDGSGSSDSDGDALSYSWKQVSGPKVWLDDFFASTTRFHVPVDAGGFIVLELEVSDGYATGTDQIVITVSNQGPVAVIRGSTATFNAGELVVLDGRGSSDPDGDRLSYRWVQTLGTPVDIGDGDMARLWFAVPDADEALGFELTVSDGVASATVSHSLAAMTYGGERITHSLTPFSGSYYDPLGSGWYAYDIARRGDLLLANGDGSGDGLYVLDISNPGQPTPLASADNSGAAYKLAFNGRLAFVGDGGTREILVFEYQALSGTLIRRGSYSFTGWVIEGLDATSDHLLLSLRRGSDNATELRAIDVRDPDQPRLAATLDLQQGKVTVSGDYAYVTNVRLNIVDLSGLDAATPTLLHVNSTATQNTCSGGMFGRIRVVGDLAYCACLAGGLQTFDLTNRSNPMRLGTLSLSGEAYDVDVAGNTAHVAAYEAGVQVVDVSDPTSMQVVSRFPTSTGVLQILASTDGSRSYVPVGEDGIQMFTGIGELGGFAGTLDTAGTCYTVTLEGDVLFASDSNIIRVLDATDPTLQTEISTVAAPGNGDMLISGARLFAASAWSSTRVSIVDLQDLMNPVVLGSPLTGTPFSALAIDGEMLMVGVRDQGLRLLDVRDPVTAPELGRLTLSGSITDMVYTSPHLMVGHPANVEVVNVSVASQPQLVGAPVALTLPIRHFGMEGGYIYGINARVDFSDPLNPGVSERHLPSIVATADLRREGPLLFLALNGGDIYVLDQSPGLDYRVLARYQTPDKPVELAIGVEQFFLADWDGGVLSFHRDRVELDSRYSTAAPSASLSYQVRWPDIAEDQGVDCRVTGGSCAVSAIDNSTETATVTWTLPDSAGDHEIGVLVGATTHFAMTYDRVRVQ
ncbi:MAG: PKD domain-containing protein [Pseudomonadota bacterium]